MERAPNIPSPQTSFIGREAEIDEITRILAGPDCRLMTLAGSGGMGKTRLSIEVARRLVHHFPDGVYFISLAAARSAEDVAAALIEATSFEAQQETGDPLEEFLDYLEPKRLLLVLDNFEQIAGEASLLSDIASRASEVRLLITSRIPLELHEEWVRHVKGLDLPAKGSGSPQESSAIKLFLNRAGQVRALDIADLESVSQICALVDGMPLAIELSAGWINTLTPSDIAREIQQNIDILTSTRRNINERHRSMRIVYDHSLELLTEDERELFKRLTVFSGGFSREAAVTLADASLPVLAMLVNKSLVHLDEHGRYTIHELLRQYSGEVDAALRERHMQYFIGLLKAAPFQSGDQLKALSDVEMEMENIRLAWEWAVHRHSAGMLEGAIENLARYSEMRGQHHVAVRMLRQVLDSPSDVPPLLESRIRARVIHMIVLGQMQNEVDAEAEVADCLRIARQHNSPADEAFCLFLQGVIVMMNRRIDEARFAARVAQDMVAPLRRAYEIFRDLGNAQCEAICSIWLGWGELFLGHTDAGFGYLQQGCEVHKAIGDRHGEAWALINLSRTYYEEHRFQEAETFGRHAIEILREFRSVKGLTMGLDTLASIALCRGQFDEARALNQEALALSRSTNHIQGEMRAYRILSVLAAIADEDYATGLSLAHQYQDISDKTAWVYDYCLIPSGLSFAACGMSDFPAMRANHRNVYRPGRNTDPTMASVILGVEVIARAREGNLTGAVELLALTQNIPEAGRKWMDQWKLLGRTQEALAAGLTPETYAEAWECGAKLDPDSVLAGIVYDVPEDARKAANNLLPEPLTEREVEVLGLVAAGLSTLEIADRLSLSTGTIKVHTKHIYQKLGVNSRTQAVVRAAEIRLI